MINAVVAIVRELLAVAQDADRIGLQVHIQAELAVAAYTGFLAHHFVNGVHQVNGATQAFTLGSLILAFNSAWVTASNVVRTDRRALS